MNDDSKIKILEACHAGAMEVATKHPKDVTVAYHRGDRPSGIEDADRIRYEVGWVRGVEIRPFEAGRYHGPSHAVIIGTWRIGDIHYDGASPDLDYIRQGVAHALAAWMANGCPSYGQVLALEKRAEAKAKARKAS